MISFFNRTLNIVVPRYDDEGNDIDNGIISSAIQSLMSIAVRTSITETRGYYGYDKGINYKFRYSPNAERGEMSDTVHHLYTMVATMLLYYEVEKVDVSIDTEEYNFDLDDLPNLKFYLAEKMYYAEDKDREG